MITRADKQEEITAISERFGRAQASFLVDFKGMDVEEVTALRKKLHPVGSEMRVVRNTLAKIALKQFPEMEKAISGDLKGTNALVFAFNDAPAAAKLLREYSEKVEELVLKAGVMDGNRLDERSIKALADLPSKEVLRAQLLGLMQAPMSKFVRTLNEVPSKFVRVLNARKEQVEKAG